MNSVAIVYWSGTGNTEAMADLVAEGVGQAGGNAEVIQCSSFSSDQIDSYDVIAFGCPAMGNEELEDMEFLPMYDEVEPVLGDKPIALFGSYDWNNGEWMDYWKERAEGAGLNVIATTIAKDYPLDEEADACVELGRKIAPSK